MTDLRDHYGYSTPSKTVELLPEILLDLQRTLPDHPAVARIEDLKQRVGALYEELELLDDLVSGMAAALRNNNYDYCDFGGVLVTPGSRLLPYLDKLVAGPTAPVEVSHE